jgi:hypothetical protein
MTNKAAAECLHVITAISRPDNIPALWGSLLMLARSLREDKADPPGVPTLDLCWWVVLDSAPRPLPPPLLRILGGKAEAVPIVPLFHASPSRDATGRPTFGHAQRNAALEYIQDGWVWALDDDNLCHPSFGLRLRELLRDHSEAGAFVVGQDRADGRRLHAAPSEVAPCRVDTAQYVVRRNVIGTERVRSIHGDDGGFIGRLYARYPERFVFCDEVLAWHNRLTVPGVAPSLTPGEDRDGTPQRPER